MVVYKKHKTLSRLPKAIRAHIHSFLGGSLTDSVERATKAGKYETVKALVSIGVPPGRSLRFAVILDRMDVVKFLVANGATSDDRYIKLALKVKEKSRRKPATEICRLLSGQSL